MINQYLVMNTIRIAISKRKRKKCVYVSPCFLFVHVFSTVNVRKYTRQFQLFPAVIPFP